MTFVVMSDKHLKFVSHLVPVPPSIFIGFTMMYVFEYVYVIFGSFAHIFNIRVVSGSILDVVNVYCQSSIDISFFFSQCLKNMEYQFLTKSIYIFCCKLKRNNRVLKFLPNTPKF